MSRLSDLDPVLKAKQDVQEKLHNVVEEKKLILECIENMILKAESAVQTILNENDKKKFLAAYRSLNHYLANCSEKLLEIHIILFDEEENKLDSHITSLSSLVDDVGSVQNGDDAPSAFLSKTPDANFQFVSKKDSISNVMEVNMSRNPSEASDVAKITLSKVVANRDLVELASRDRSSLCKGSFNENTGNKLSAQVFNCFSSTSSYHSFSPLSSSSFADNKDEVQPVDLKSCVSKPESEVGTVVPREGPLVSKSFSEANLISSEHPNLSLDDSLRSRIPKHEAEDNSSCNVNLLAEVSLLTKRDMPSCSQSSKLIELSSTDDDEYCSPKNASSKYSQDLSSDETISREETDSVTLVNATRNTDTQLLDCPLRLHSGDNSKDLLLLTVSDRRDHQCCVKDSSTELPCTINCVIPPYQTEVAVDMSFVENRSTFWLQPNKEQFQELLMELQSIQVSDSPPCLVKGEHYLAPYGNLSGWHRVRLLQEPSSDGIAQIHYIDYGNKESIPSASLKTLAPGLCVFPAQALRCHLEGANSEEKEISSVVTLLENSSNSNSLFAIFSSPVAMQYPVELFIRSVISPCYLNVAKYISTCHEDSSASSIKGKSDTEMSCQFGRESARITSDTDNLCSFTIKIEEKVKEGRTNAVGAEIFKDKQNKSESVFLNGCPERPKSNLSSESEYYSSISSSSSALSQRNGKDRLNRDDCLGVKVSKPEIVLLQGNSTAAMVSVIIHPREFYVHIVSEKSSQLDDLAEQLNSYYTNKSCKRIPAVNVKSLQIGSFWACQYSEDRCWYRVVVLEVAADSKSTKLPAKDTLVQYIDYGNKEYVCVEDLWPLPQFLTCLPAFAVRCALARLQPMYDENCHSRSDWGDEAVNRFMDLAPVDKCFTAQFLSPLNSSVLEVILWNSEHTSINDILVREGLAMRSSSNSDDCVSEASKSELGSAEYLAACWNPMADDYLNEQNRYEADLDDPEIAFIGHKAKDEKYICKFFSRGDRCYRGSRCPYQHIRAKGAFTLDKEEVITYDLNIDLPAVGTSVLAQVSAAFNPAHFYLIFPYGTIPIDDSGILSYPEVENLDKFVKSMSMYYNNTKLKKSLTHHALGKIVAARSKFDNQWYRARIYDTNTTESKVFYVDFGNCDWVCNSDLEEIDPKFLDYPFQAVESRLANVQMKEKQNPEMYNVSWDLFRSLIEDKIVLVRIVGHMESMLFVDLYPVPPTCDISMNEELVRLGVVSYEASMF